MAFASQGFYKWGLPSKKQNTAKFTQPKPPLPEEYNRNRIPEPAGKITPIPTGGINTVFPKNSGSIYGFPKAAKFIPLPNPPPQKYNTSYLQPPMGRNTPVPNKHLVSNVFDALHEKEADDKPTPEQSVLETATILNESNPSSYLQNVIAELTMLKMRSKIRNLTQEEKNRKNNIETEFNEFLHSDPDPEEPEPETLETGIIKTTMNPYTKPRPPSSSKEPSRLEEKKEEFTSPRKSRTSGPKKTTPKLEEKEIFGRKFQKMETSAQNKFFVNLRAQALKDKKITNPEETAISKQKFITGPSGQPINVDRAKKLLRTPDSDWILNLKTLSMEKA